MRDITIVNSDGIANDPTGMLHQYGGEINTPPTDTILGQVECLREIKKLFPEAKVNYRSNLHVHVRVPGLKDDLNTLKQVQAFIHRVMPEVFPIVEPIPRPTATRYPDPDELKGALRRYRRRLVSHHTLLSKPRLHRQLQAKTIEEFFNLEPPQSKGGKPLWHAQPRLCVSLRQLLQTDTVEFRHFPGTLDETLLLNCVDWCVKFMAAALGKARFPAILEWAQKRRWPEFPEYVHWQECRYRATVHDGTLTKAEIVENIKAIKEGRFDAGPGRMSREHQQVGVVRGPARTGDLF
ncbi:MAG TPA: hypothetical protein VHC20_04510, partial [Candidatus Paceibacterota bacterium]|nr:hypothetical protein [Candidatus Paceibacterota bacterium]